MKSVVNFDAYTEHLLIVHFFHLFLFFHIYSSICSFQCCTNAADKGQAAFSSLSLQWDPPWTQDGGGGGLFSAIMKQQRVPISQG